MKIRAFVLSMAVVLAGAGVAAAQEAPTGSWTEKAPGTYMVYGASATDGAWLYVFGGNDAAGASSAFRRYSPATDAWEDLPAMPEAVTVNCGAFWNGYVYSFGNWATFGNIHRYDIANGAWETLATTVNEHSIAAQAVTVGNKIYLLGGFVAWAGPSSACTEFDPATETLTPMSPMPDGMGYHAACAVNGRIYVAGGNASVLADEGGVKSGAYEYDPATDTWTTLAPMATPRDSLVAFGVNGRAYFAGGRQSTAAGDLYYAESWELNPANGEWKQRASTAVAHMGGVGGAIGSKGYVFASHPNASVTTDSLEEFTPPAFGGTGGNPGIDPATAATDGLGTGGGVAPPAVTVTATSSSRSKKRHCFLSSAGGASPWFLVLVVAGLRRRAIKNI